MARITRRRITKVIKETEASAEKMGAKAKKLAVKAMDKISGKEAARKKRNKVAAALTGVAAVVAAGVAVARSRNANAKKVVKVVKKTTRAKVAQVRKSAGRK
jgi:hypothetical protein